MTEWGPSNEGPHSQDPRGRVPAASGAAHAPQNLAAGGLACPQAGHTTERRVAHSVQNVVPVGFSVSQVEQIKPIPAY